MADSQSQPPKADDLTSGAKLAIQAYVGQWLEYISKIVAAAILLFGAAGYFLIQNTVKEATNKAADEYNKSLVELTTKTRELQLKFQFQLDLADQQQKDAAKRLNEANKKLDEAEGVREQIHSRLDKLNSLLSVAESAGNNISALIAKLAENKEFIKAVANTSYELKFAKRSHQTGAITGDVMIYKDLIFPFDVKDAWAIAEQNIPEAGNLYIKEISGNKVVVGYCPPSGKSANFVFSVYAIGK